MSRFSRLRSLHRTLAFAGLVVATAAAAAVVRTSAKAPGAGGAPPAASGRDAPLAAPAQGGAQGHAIEAVFVLDTTGSMSGLLEGAKRKIWSIADGMAGANPNVPVRIGLVAYRDRGDLYVTQRLDLTEDLDAVFGRLSALRAEGGGDTPESVNQALHEAVTLTSWSRGPGVYRTIFLVGDAPPQRYQDDVGFAESAALARRRDVVINTVQCGGLPETTPVWQEIARLGRGQYAAIAGDGAVVALATPMDEELAVLNRELAATVLPYGAAEEQAELAAKLEGAVAAAPEAAASRLSYLAKRGGRVNLGRKDLVDAVASREVDAAALPETELPQPMRSLAPEARNRYVADLAKQREALQRRIAALSAERDAYVRAETERLAAEGKGDGFDQKVLGAVREQAAQRGIE
jgi:hypothetical protein